MSPAEMFTVGASIGSALVALAALAVKLGDTLARLTHLQGKHDENSKQWRDATRDAELEREKDRARLSTLELAKAAADVEQANTAKELAKLAAIIDERIPRRRERAR